MTVLARVVTSMTGFNGGPGVNVLNFSGGTLGDNWSQEGIDGLYDEVVSLYTSWLEAFLNTISITVDPVIDIFEDNTGDLVGTFGVTEPSASLVGTGSSLSIARSQCICVAYYTDMFVAGKRLKGRSFLGPISAAVLDTNGDVNSAVRAAAPGRFTALTSGVGPRLAVWHRPSNATGSDGYYGDVVSVIARARVTNLRTRQP